MITLSKIGKMGRLGNEMFQFASLYGVHKRTGFLIHLKWNLGTRYFNICYPPLQKKHICHRFREECMSKCFDASVFKIKDNTDLVGYFQSPKYFNFCKEDIYSLYTPKQEISNGVEQLLSKYNIGKQFIILHVRGSDYLSPKEVANTGGIPGASYYVDSLQFICRQRQKQLDDFTILLFSDDIEVAKKITKAIQNVQSVDSTPAVALFAMTRVPNLIISPSSFAWWGAYLNQEENQIVCCPKYWRYSKHKKWYPGDILVKNWKTIPVTQLYSQRSISSELEIKWINLKRLFKLYV